MFGCKPLILSVLEMVTAFDRNEQVRENPVRTLAAARDRERCKHASDYLHRGKTTYLSSVVSVPIPIKKKLETCLDEIQAIVASLIGGHKHHTRGRSKTERRDTRDRQEKIPLYVANTELIGIAVRVNPPTPHAQICVRMNPVCDLLHIKRRTTCSQSLRP